MSFPNALVILKKLARKEEFQVNGYRYSFTSVPQVDYYGGELGFDFDLQCEFSATGLHLSGIQKFEATSTVPILSLNNNIYRQVMDSLTLQLPSLIPSPKITADSHPAIQWYVDEEVARLKKLIKVRV